MTANRSAHLHDLAWPEAYPLFGPGCLIHGCHTDTAVPEGAVELSNLVRDERYGLCRCCGEQLVLLWH